MQVSGEIGKRGEKKCRRVNMDQRRLQVTKIWKGKEEEREYVEKTAEMRKRKEMKDAVGVGKMDKKR